MKFFLIVVTVLILVLLTYLMINTQAEMLKRFETEAKEYLETDNFRIENHDGVLVAVTKDGRQYPLEEWIQSYWQYRLIYTAISGGVIVALAFILLMFADWYVKREEKRRDS